MYMPSMYIYDDVPGLVEVAGSIEEASVRVAHYSEWEGARTGDGAWVLAGAGEARERGFDWEGVEEIARWLDEAHILDVYLLTAPGDLDSRELLDAFGTLLQFLEKFGDLFTRAGERSAVGVVAGIQELALLRYALKVAVEMRAGPGPLTRRLVREQGYGALAWFDYWSGSKPELSEAVCQAAAARTWFAWKAAYEGAVRPLAWLEGPPGRARIVAVPATGMQALWWVAAITAGALEPPFPVPGVGVCGDPKCGRLFILRPGRRNRKDRPRVFCSPECARKFHKREWARKHPRPKGGVGGQQMGHIKKGR